MAITYPVGCDAVEKKAAYCRRALELVRLQYNLVGKWFREGISQKEYDGFGEDVKTRFSYKDRLTKNDWQKYREMHDVLQEKVVVAELAIRAELASLNTWDSNIKNQLRI